MLGEGGQLLGSDEEAAVSVDELEWGKENVFWSRVPCAFL